MAWHDEGEDPDYRFSLANERTFLAWIRTALAILAGALVLDEFSRLVEPAWIKPGVSACLAVLAFGLSLGAYHRWRGNELAMRLGKSLPRSPFLPILSISMTVFAGAIAIYLIWRM